MYRRRTVLLLQHRRYTKGKSCSLLALPCHFSIETETLAAPHRLYGTSLWRLTSPIGGPRRRAKPAGVGSLDGLVSPRLAKTGTHVHDNGLCGQTISTSTEVTGDLRTVHATGE